MGKGSGGCDRAGSCPESSGSESELDLDEGFTSVGEINTGLELQRVAHLWWTKDELVTFGKRKEGWIVGAFSDPARKAFEEYGLIYQQAGTNSYEYTYFPSLEAVRQAVNDVSLEAGLNIDSRLTRGKYIAYKIGDLPLKIRKNQGHWRVATISSALSQSLEKHFNSVEEFLAAWESTDIALVHYPTRKAAHQAAINWLAQTMAAGK